VPVLSRQEIEAELGPCQECDQVGSPSGSGECWRVVRNGQVQAFKAIVKHPDRARFEREVEAMQRVNSPRVVRVEGRGEITASDGKVYPYLLSEFIDGMDASKKLAAEGPPADDGLRSLIDGALVGVQALHGASIIHRDLKPANLMLRGGDWAEPVIIDLGLSRLPDLTTITRYPWAGGTIPYMAPEQLAGERAIDRTDLWGIAVIAGELAAGEHPFLRGATQFPADWDSRLQAGFTVPAARPTGLAEWISEVGRYEAYRRPSAVDASALLDAKWAP
jgi:serine/threonine protein kinase